MTAPEPISARHDVSRFRAGAESLDAWQRRARLNKAKGGSRTYVVCDGDRVIGFYILSASSVERGRVSSRVGRSMPEPIPVILLGELAVDTAYRGRGFRGDLLSDAAQASAGRGRVIGSRAVVVQALDDDVKGVLRTIRLPGVLES